MKKFKKPQPGNVVTVTTKYKSNLLDKDYDITTYENVRVLKSENWEGPDDFRVADPTAPFDGIRIINMKAVIDLQVNDQVAEEEFVDPNSRIVMVAGSKGQEYSVKIENGSPVSCTCIGFQYRRKCRHLNEALEKVDSKSKKSDNMQKGGATHTKSLRGADIMSKASKNLNGLGWSDRFALIDHYNPSDEAACAAFNVTQDELDTARDLRASGTFQPSGIDVKGYDGVFAVTASKQSVSGGSIGTTSGKGAKVTSHTKPTDEPQTATKPIKAPKKRGRKGTKIQAAFTAIPATPVPVEQFATDHNVSVAVLRQSKRFDKTGLGPVKVKKDKDVGQLMIWREADSE